MAARARWIKLTGFLQGHHVKARPLSGYESMRMLDLSTQLGVAEATVYALDCSILEWSTPDKSPIDPTVDFLRGLPPEALDCLQSNLDAIMSEKAFVKQVPLSDSASATSPESSQA